LAHEDRRANLEDRPGVTTENNDGLRSRWRIERMAWDVLDYAPEATDQVASSAAFSVQILFSLRRF
jgi:hypothetical protein